MPRGYPASGVRRGRRSGASRNASVGLVEVLNYIVYHWRRKGYRPAHIAGQIAARDMGMSKSTFWRITRILEVSGLVGCERRPGGQHNLGSLYWPTVATKLGRELLSASPTVRRNGHGLSTVSHPNGGRLSSSEAASQTAPLSEANWSERTKPEFDRTSSGEPEYISRTPADFEVSTFPTPERTPGVQSPLFERGKPAAAGTADGLTAEISLSAASGSAQTPAGGTHPQSPSHTVSNNQRRIPVRVLGQEEEVRMPGIPNDVRAAMEELLEPGERRRIYRRVEVAPIEKDPVAQAQLAEMEKEKPNAR